MFRHERLNELELQKFMQENEDFLLKVQRDTGRTNLSEFFTNYLSDKQKQEIEDATPKDVMIPPSLI